MVIKQVAVLLDVTLEGVEYKAGNVIELENSLAKAYAASGEVDLAAEAVAYRLSQGEEVKNHKAETAAAAADASSEATT